MADLHREKINMQLWMDDKAQVIVATNAFGMGIDKQMSRPLFTFHFKIENYYGSRSIWQKWRKAFAVLLTNPSDIKQAENQFIHILPDKSF
jgi:ATP-dependent DNA helicase RecQ